MSLSGGRVDNRVTIWLAIDLMIGWGIFVCAGYELFVQAGGNYTGRKKERCKCTAHIRFVLSARADCNKSSA